MVGGKQHWYIVGGGQGCFKIPGLDYSILRLCLGCFHNWICYIISPYPLTATDQSILSTGKQYTPRPKAVLVLKCPLISRRHQVKSFSSTNSYFYRGRTFPTLAQRTVTKSKWYMYTFIPLDCVLIKGIGTLSFFTEH